MFRTREANICIGLIIVFGITWLAATLSQRTVAGRKDCPSNDQVQQVALNTANLQERGCSHSQTPAALPVVRSEDIPEELRLLSRIRQEIGSPLNAGGLFSESSQTASGEGQEADSFHAAYREEAAREQPAESTFEAATKSVIGATDPDLICTSAFRRAARELDSAAADLEDLNAFERADLLRTHAGQLRDEARTLSTKAAIDDCDDSPKP